jgi:hypothetical protein
MLKRVSIILLAIAFVIGATVQLMPRAVAMHDAAGMSDDMSMTMSAAEQSSDGDMPCKGMTPACVDTMGCAVVLALPAPSASAPTPILWGVISYSTLVIMLDGLAVEPELFPPIPTA